MKDTFQNMTTEERKKIYAEFMPTFLSDKYYMMGLDELGFFTAPASTKFHGAYEGGLFDHSFLVAKYLVELTEKLGLKWERAESPYIVGMFHDICKCGLYKLKADGSGYDFNADLIVSGHGDRSVILLYKLFTYMARITDEELACIRWHMGAYETDTRLWQNYNAAVIKYANVLFTHTADMYVAKVLGV